MYSFGKRSKKNLKDVHPDMLKLCEEVIKHMDFSVIEGHRSLERQKHLHDMGYSQIDGISKKGKHNYLPSLAVDVIPYKKGFNPFDGSERAELDFYRLNREFQRASRKLNITTQWGGTWRMLDYPHYQLD